MISSPAATWTYAYDHFGNLRSASQGFGGTTLTYEYDGFNRLVGKKRNGTPEQRFIYDGSRVIAELNGTGSVVTRFLYATGSHSPDGMIKQVGGFYTTFRIFKDQLGSPRLVTNTAGAVYQRMSYDEWGNVTQDTAQGFQPFGFAGGIYDFETKLVRFGARDYDPSIGRWTSKDASRFGGGLNFYAYAGNDPVNVIDVTGHMPEDRYGGMTSDETAAQNAGAEVAALGFAGLVFRPLGFLLAAGLGIKSDKDLWKVPLLGGLPRTTPMDAVRSRFPNGDCRTLSRELVNRLGEGQLIEMAPANGTTLPHGWEVHQAVELPGGGIMDPTLGASFGSAGAWQRAIVGDGTVLISRSPWPPKFGPPLPGDSL